MSNQRDNTPLTDDNLIITGGKAVDSILYSPAYTIGDASNFVFDKDTGRLLVATTSGTTITNDGTFAFPIAEDAASLNGDKGVGILAIRTATPIDKSGSEGDYEFLQIKDGRLWISGTITSSTPGTGATNLGKAEDSPHTTGDTGVMMLGVRNDSNATTTNTDLDYSSISTDSSGRLKLSAGEQHLGSVGGNTGLVTSTLVMSAAGAYSTGDYIGTTTTRPFFANAVRVSGGTGVIRSIRISDKTVTAAVAMELWVFSATFTSPTDNAAWAITDGEAFTCLGVIPIDSSKWYASSNNKVYMDDTVSLIINPAATSLFYALVARGTTPTWASGDLDIGLGILQD